MRNFAEREMICSLVFNELGDCHHLWTPENFEIIFTCEQDFKLGMSIMAIAAAEYPDVKVITFELMTNHLHIAAAGEESRLMAMFSAIKRMLQKFVATSGRFPDWNAFVAKTRKIESLDDFRKVIVYDNKNGYVVSPEHTPFTYPWGANRYYFNPDAWEAALVKAKPMTVRDLRIASHSKTADKLSGLKQLNGYALPTSFCDIRTGESLFRDASHYFQMISRSIESSKEIAKEIGENIFYNDDELYSLLSSYCKKQYGESVPSRLMPIQKIETAKHLRFEYNASVKQIQRMLKVGTDVTDALGF